MVSTPSLNLWAQAVNEQPTYMFILPILVDQLIGTWEDLGKVDCDSSGITITLCPRVVGSYHRLKDHCQGDERVAPLMLPDLSLHT